MTTLPVAERVPGATDWRLCFLAALRECRNVRQAALRVGIGRRTVYDLKTRDAAFCAAMEAACVSAATAPSAAALAHARACDPAQRDRTLQALGRLTDQVEALHQAVEVGAGPAGRYYPVAFLELAVTQAEKALLVYLEAFQAPHTPHTQPDDSN